MEKNKGRIFLVILLIVTVLVGYAAFNNRGNDNASSIDYSDINTWAYYESNEEVGLADVFFVGPTVYYGSEDAMNMSLDDEEQTERFLHAVNQEKGIYDQDNVRFFAPYYEQAGLNAYSVEDSDAYFEIAYQDVKAAFEYYLENENDGTPIVLAGFSQGADMCIRLLKDEFADEEVNDLLVACYAIGWRITEEEMDEYPHLKFAQGEDDTGVIIAFDCEDGTVTDTPMIPEGIKTLSINPLTWTTTNEVADKSLNKGAVFTKSDGSIREEIPELTGAYIDEQRGSLICTDVTSEEYPPYLDIFSDGVFHLYDWEFFYRNIQENVMVRMQAYAN